MSAIAIEIVVVLLLVLVNGVLSMSETAVVSARRLRLQQRAEEGDPGAIAAFALASEPGPFLSTVQIGITLIGVVTGVFGGATLADQIAAPLARVPALAPYASGLALAIVTIPLTYLSLVIGELVPKRIALNAPERVAARMARPMTTLARLTAPLVRLLTASTDLVMRAIGVRRPTEPHVTEEEIRALIEQGAQSGVVQEAEQDIVEGAFRLGDLQVSALMTPRPELEWVDVADAVAEIREQLARGRASRFLLCDGSVEKVVGIVHAEDLLMRALAGEPLDPSAVARPPLFVPGTLPAIALLEAFRESGQQAAVALDEYGGVQGMITRQELLAELLRDLPVPVAGATGVVEVPMVRREDGSWLVEGDVPIEDVEEQFDLPELPVVDRRGFRTLAGFVMAQLGRVPREGDVVDYAGVRFEVVDMDGRRVDKVLVVPRGEGE